MSTRTVTFAEVRPGDRFRKQIINRSDPRYGEYVVLTVDRVQDDGGGWFSIRGTTTELDYLGNPYGGGPGGRLTSTIEILDERRYVVEDDYENSTTVTAPSAEDAIREVSDFTGIEPELLTAREE